MSVIDESPQRIRALQKFICLWCISQNEIELIYTIASGEPCIIWSGFSYHLNCFLKAYKDESSEWDEWYKKHKKEYEPISVRTVSGGLPTLGKGHK